MTDNNTITAENEALILAAQNGDTGHVIQLLNAGADPNTTDSSDRGALHYAATSNHHATVKALLAADADLFMEGPPPEDPEVIMNYAHPRETIYLTPLGTACQLGHIESVKEMLPYLKENPYYVEICIQLSIEFRHVNLAKSLIRSSDMAIGTDLGGELLLTAASKGDCEMMQLLLKLGIDPHYRREDHRKAFIQGSVQDIVDSSLLVSICNGYASRKAIGLNPAADSFEKALEIALQAGCDVNITGHMDRTPLHWAVSSGLPALEKLLERGADVNCRDQDGNTPLHLLYPSPATKETIDILTRHGANWDAVRAQDGKRPVHTAVESRSPDLDLTLLQPFVKEWIIQDAKGDTPLHLLARAFIPPDRAERLIRQLIALGADVNAKNEDGQTPVQVLDPIHMASYGTLFFQAGAYLEERDHQGRTWFLRSVMTDHDLPRRTLKAAENLNLDIHATDDGRNNALHLSCGKNTSMNPHLARNIKALIKAGVDPRQTNKHGDTLYHIVMGQAFQSPAAEFLPILKILRKAKVPVLAQNKDGETLLHRAMSVRLVVFYRDLLYPDRNPLDFFSDEDISTMIHTPDIRARYPIHIAAASEESFVWWLISRGADWTVRTTDGMTALHIAAEARQGNVIGLLLETLGDSEKKEAVNQRDESRRTPLHHACRSGRPESVRLLLVAGAIVDIPDQDGRTPLHACAEFEKPDDVPKQITGIFATQGVRPENEALRVSDIVHLLCDHGAGIIERDANGKTAIDLAIAMSNEEMATALTDELRRGPEELRAAFEDSLDASQRTYLADLDARVTSILNDMLADHTSKQNIPWTTEKLLALGAHSAVQDLVQQGHSLIGELGSFNPIKRDFLESLVRQGYTDLFNKLGRTRENTTWINGSVTVPFSDMFGIRPLVITAALRAQPSQDLLSSVIETFNADPNIKIQNSAHRDACALHILSEGKYWWQTDAITYLLAHGADPNITDGLNRSALHFAVNGGYRRLEIVKLLVEGGADPNIKDYQGMTPINQAVGDHEMIGLLVEHGADMTAGRRPVLYGAVESYDAETVRVILELGKSKGMDLDRPFRDRDFVDETDPPSHYASWKSEREKLCLRPLELAVMQRPVEPRPCVEHDAGKMEAIARLLLQYGAQH